MHYETHRCRRSRQRRLPRALSRSVQACRAPTAVSRRRTRASPAIASRCTPCTAARTCSGRTRRRSSARSRCAALDEYAPDARDVRASAGPRRARDGRAFADDDPRARRRQADARAGRGLPDRLRGRLRQSGPTRKRTATPRRRRSRWRRGCAAARCRRSSASASSRCRRSCTRAACARSICSSPTLARATGRTAAAELRRHGPEADGAGARRGGGVERATRSSGGCSFAAARSQLELMIETPQSILGAGRTRRRCARSSPPASGRVTGAHFGTYDYTALCGITASWQHMRHQACDFAKHMMQVALAQTRRASLGRRDEHHADSAASAAAAS